MHTSKTLISILYVAFFAVLIMGFLRALTERDNEVSPFSWETASAAVRQVVTNAADGR
jgi:hypothetical protein